MKSSAKPITEFLLATQVKQSLEHLLVYEFFFFSHRYINITLSNRGSTTLKFRLETWRLFFDSRQVKIETEKCSTYYYLTPECFDVLFANDSST